MGLSPRTKSSSTLAATTGSSPCPRLVEFRAVDGKINYGFDPMVGDMEVGSKVWASVCVDSDSVGRNNVSVKLVIDPSEDADSMELVIDGEDEVSVDITPKTFSQGETNLTIYGLSIANPQITIRARVKGQSDDCAILYVKVLSLRNCKLAIYRVTDSNSSGTAPIVAPADSVIVDTVNDVFKQACIKYTLVESANINIKYDIDPKDGKAEQIELNNPPFSYSWGGKIRAVLVKASGIPYEPPYQNIMIGGIQNTSYNYGIIFTSNNLQGYIGLVVAHELGHVLDLDHDENQWPVETQATNGALMKNGEPQGDPNNPTLPQPGRWIRHTDWQLANDTAVGFE